MSSIAVWLSWVTQYFTLVMLEPLRLKQPRSHHSDGEVGQDKLEDDQTRFLKLTYYARLWN